MAFQVPRQPIDQPAKRGDDELRIKFENRHLDADGRSERITHWVRCLIRWIVSYQAIRDSFMLKIPTDQLRVLSVARPALLAGRRKVVLELLRRMRHRQSRKSPTEPPIQL